MVSEGLDECNLIAGVDDESIEHVIKAPISIAEVQYGLSCRHEVDHH
jgi:hypothetical protein